MTYQSNGYVSRVGYKQQFSAGAAAGVDLETALVRYWPMQTIETSGGDHVTDTVGAMELALSGTYALDTQGGFTGVDFGGGDSDSAFVSSISDTYTSSTTGMTLMVWTYPQSFVGTRYNYFAIDQDQVSMRSQATTGNASFNFVAGGGNSDPLTINSWNLYIVKVLENRDVFISINGVAFDQVGPGLADWGATNHYRIGGDGINNGVSGLVAHARSFNRIFTDDEAATLFAAGPA
jgi:hypothetical protein